MTADTAFAVLTVLDKAERILGDVRLHATGETLHQRLISNRETPALTRRHLDETRSLA